MGQELPKLIYEDLGKRFEQAHHEKLRSDSSYRGELEKAEREAAEKRSRDALGPLDKL